MVPEQIACVCFRYSTLGGTILRVNLFDDANTAAMFDYPAWNAQSFDAVTNVWIHSAIVVDQTSIKYYVNGERADDSAFGFFMGNSGAGLPYV